MMCEIKFKGNNLVCFGRFTTQVTLNASSVTSRHFWTHFANQILLNNRSVPVTPKCNMKAFIVSFRQSKS